MTDTAIGLPHTHPLPDGRKYYCSDPQCAGTPRDPRDQGATDRPYYTGRPR